MKNIVLLVFFITFINAENLIVDQSSMSQYEKDDYIYFDSFDFNGTYHGNNTQQEDGSFPDPIDRIYLPEDFPILGTQFTIEAWVFSQGLFSITNLSHRTIIGDDSNPASNDQNRPPMITFQYDHQIRYGFGTGTDGFRKIVNDIRVDDEWIHVAFTFNGTTCKLFVNGELADSTDQAAGLIPNQVPISLIGRKFIGKMDEIRIWNTSREQEQIQSTMNGELNGDEEGLIAYYPMSVNENWQLEDYTENQNHATIDNVEILQEYFSNECEYPDGSSQCPFPTIRSALDVVESGDNITIRDGRYSEVLFRELLNFSHETEGPKITIEGDGENVILDGTIPLNANWENSGGTYVAEVDMNDISKRAGIKIEDIYGLWIDDRYMIPAMPINFKNPTDPTTGTQNNPEPGTVWSLHLTAPYEYVDMVQDEYTVGDLDNLDGLEEWSFDKENSRLHLIPGNNIPDSTNARVRIRTNILSFESSDNIEFKNIDFFAGTFFFHNGSFIILEDMNFSHSWESGLRHYELGIFWTWRGNYFHQGTNNTIRNCIFQYINDAFPFITKGSMNSLLENVLFRYNDWFKNTTWAPSTSDNYRGDNWWTGTIGPHTWRYITTDQINTGGIQPGLKSLVEYARVENQYIDIDGSGINRTPGPTVGSTTRYCWLLNTNRNGMRFDGGCAATDGMIHHVVSAGNKRGFRLKGDWHQAYHLTAYDNLTTDISMPPNKYCGDDWDNNDNGVENNQGNFNSQIHNCIVEGSLGCTSPDCGDPSITYTPDGADNVDENIANLISPEFLLNESGIWYGRMLNVNHTTPFAYPQLDLQMPWTENRIRSEESLVSQFGENPFENAIQDYDFRPKKESVLIDGGVVVPGINDGQDQGIDLNHTPLYAGQNRAYIGAAPDIGAYEYGDSVYWIPGYRYSYPSVPIPSDGAIEVSMDYGLAFNYPWKTDYSGTVALVSVSGPGINRTETFQYPNNVFFESFQPGETYNWSVTVDGVSGGNWSFTVSDKTYPLNDRSLDTTFVDSMLIPYQTNNLQVFHRNLAFLKFDIPSSINNSCIIHLNLVPEEVETLAGGIVVYKYNYTEWGEKLDGNNIGLVDHSLLTPIDTIFAIETNVPLQIDISNVISADGLHSFALGVVDSTDHVTFYSKEKLLTDGEYIVSEGHLSETGGGSGYAPMKSVWPNLSFQLQDVNSPPTVFDLISPSDSTELVITANDIDQEMELEILWESSTDVDGDELSYQYLLYNGIYNASESAIFDTVLSDTILNIHYQELVDLVDELGQTMLDGQWTVFTTDGIDTTMSNYVWNILIDASGVQSIHGDIIPEVYALHQNYPNPFNPTTRLRYDLPKDTDVRITIYDIMGREIRALVNSQQNAGYKSIQWNATNNAGQPVSAGLYLYTIQAGQYQQTKKMVLLK